MQAIEVKWIASFDRKQDLGKSLNLDSGNGCYVTNDDSRPAPGIHLARSH